MKSSRFTIILVAVLLTLLGVLAYLQYAWLGQISDGERERLQRNLQMDTQRFAEEFNREIQNAYFNFLVDGKVFSEKNWSEFNERYDFWREKATYPELIKEFYFVETESGAILRFNKENRLFESANWTENLNKLKPKLSQDESLRPIAEEVPALLMPVREMTEKLDRILVRKPQTENVVGQRSQIPTKIGTLIIELDELVFKNQIFPDLVKKYFSANDSANYRLAVVNRENQTIYQTENLTATDANAKLFEISPDNLMFFANREIINSIEQGRNKTMVFSKMESQKLEQTTINDSNTRFEMTVTTNDKPRVRVVEGKLLDESAVWTLNVQHTAGSLEQFITNTRRKNLGISFGILSLLGISIVLILLSAQRARAFAQKQIDFVSSVSHEFRTPLAVIYSAGENLADGVAKEETQVWRYGDLIKGEGRKLSKMVEQILDFAGANSGKKKYDFRSLDVKEIIENALLECESLLKDFTVETEIEENLPPIIADQNALGQAFQNLIINSIKYSNETKFIKISAKNGNGKMQISVEDKGIGIEKSDLKHIFEPFFRAKLVVDEQIHGNGLGLSLVKETVEAHNGKISAESEIGKGSKFTIILTT
ncbi:MAG TPA: HAMP domain-containing sensor histidine kinase [Pyrinomonadaceae bacterium]|nr:HAMP domain-containing sensor histidine kinase [Pyrinomonadaceae bacterium]